MTILALAVILATMLGPCAALYIKGDLPVGRTLPYTVCAQSLALLTLGYVLPYSFIVWGLAALSAACWLYYLLRAGSFRRLLSFFSVPCLLLIAAAPVLYYACCNRLYLSYDEYSHWGLIIKAIAAFDALPRAGAGADFLLYTYPPMGALYPAMICTVMGYSDGAAYFGYAMMLWALMMGLLPRKGHPLVMALSAALTGLCLVTLFPFAVLRLFVEPLIAILFVLLILPALDQERTAFDHLGAALVCACLILTKSSSPIYVLLALMLRLFMDRSRGERIACLREGGFALLAFAGYALYCRANGISKALLTGDDNGLSSLLSGAFDPVFASVPARFIKAFLTQPYPQSGVYSCYAVNAAPVVLFAALALLCVPVVFLARDRRQTARFLAGLHLLQGAYILSLIGLYMFAFTAFEAEYLLEFDRYTALPALIIGLTLTSVFSREAASGGRAYAAGLAVSALALMPLCHPKLMADTLITRSAVQDTLWARYYTDEYTSFLRSHMDLSQRRSLYIMGTCDSYKLHLTLMPDVLVTAQLDNWDGTQPVTGPDAAKAQMLQSGCEYVFCGLAGDAPGYGLDGYGPLLPEGEALLEQALYSVEHTDAGPRLNLIAVLPPL